MQLSKGFQCSGVAVSCQTSKSLFFFFFLKKSKSESDAFMWVTPGKKNSGCQEYTGAYIC